MELSLWIWLAVFIQEGVSFTTWKTIAGCRLNAETLYPWLVAIWWAGGDEKATHGEYYGHGVLITYKAVLTACSPTGEHTSHRFGIRHSPAHINQFYVYAQHINVTALINKEVGEADAVDCDIVSPVVKYVQHPKCEKDPKHADDYRMIEQLFNFAGFVLKDYLPIWSSHYPTLPMPLSPETFIGDVSYINILDGYGCEIVWFEPRGAPSRNIVIGGTAFPGAPFVKPIPFQSKCLQALCEERPNKKDKVYEKCRNFFGNRANATRLCMKPKWTKSLTGKINEGTITQHAYIGAPLVCNGTGYGHVSFIKVRNSQLFPNDEYGDFFFVTTYLRAWPWIQEFRRNYTYGVKEWYVEQQNLQTEVIPPASRAPINGEVVKFHQPRLPYGVVGPIVVRNAPANTRAKGTRTVQHQFIGYVVISCWLAISNSNL